jgi:hypothetical protein
MRSWFRVLPWVRLAVLSLAWIVFVKATDAKASGAIYLLPVMLGVSLVMQRVLPPRLATRLPAVIGAAVAVTIAIGWKLATT